MCRLTQNVVDGFGVSGVEGVYRRCCEITLSVLRQHKGSIIRWGQWWGSRLSASGGGVLPPSTQDSCGWQDAGMQHASRAVW